MIVVRIEIVKVGESSVDMLEVGMVMELGSNMVLCWEKIHSK